MAGEIVGVAEIAKLLGVTRQQVNRLANDDPTFPKPLARLKAGRFWNLADITEWMAHRRPPGRPRGT